MIAEKQTFTLSGTINSLAFSDVDGDVPSPDYPSKGNNLEPLEIQAILNPTQLIGHLSYDPSSDQNDEWDIYRLDLVGGQYASLEITDWDEDNPNLNDLDLYILDSDGEPFRTSTGSEWYETVTLPSEGTYYIAVNAYAGASKYVLTIGSIYSGFQLSNYSSEVGIQFGKLLLAPKNGSRFNDLFKNKNYNSIKFEKGSFFDFKDNNLNKSNNDIYDINDFDPELKKAAGILSSRLRDSFIYANPQQIQEIIFRKYISFLSASFSNFYIEPVFTSSSQSFVPTSNFKYQWDYLAINLPEAVNAVGRSSNYTVAVLDTGLQVLFLSLHSHRLCCGGYDFIDNDSDPTGPSANNHGAHVAGTIAASNSV